VTFCAPLTYRPELPLRWYERMMVAFGIPFEPRRGDAIPLMFDRECPDGAVYFIDPHRGPIRIGGER
jgi:hypothetical protein